MRKKIVAGNWKMNKSRTEAQSFIHELNNISSSLNSEVEVVVFPPSVYLPDFQDNVSERIRFGSQNVASHRNGAYTGEISADMLKHLCCSYAIIGHSERRAYFKESNQDLGIKANLLIENKITPIYCCGENLEERESGNHFDIVKKQIQEGLFHLTKSHFAKVVIAYEPIWAIGTGKTASSTQAQEMHAHIRSVITQKYGEDIANEISILYGGSCKPSNAQELFACADVDGGLIGGASLEVTTFSQIINSF